MVFKYHVTLTEAMKAIFEVEIKEMLPSIAFKTFGILYSEKEFHVQLWDSDFE